MANNTEHAQPKVSKIEGQKASGTQQASPGNIADQGQDLEAQGRQSRYSEGILGLYEFQADDRRHMVARCFSPATACCIEFEAEQVAKLWKMVSDSLRNGGDRPEELLRKLSDQVARYQKLLLSTSQVNKLERASKSVRSDVIAEATARRKDGGGMFMEGQKDHIASVDAARTDKFDDWILEMIYTRWGKMLLAPWKKVVGEDDETSYLQYPAKVLRALLLGIFNSIIAAFFGLPVVLQALKISSRAGDVAMYMIYLLAFSFVVSLLLPNMNTALVIVVAYAALIGANMRRN